MIRKATVDREYIKKYLKNKVWRDHRGNILHDFSDYCKQSWAEVKDKAAEHLTLSQELESAPPEREIKFHRYPFWSDKQPEGWKWRNETTRPKRERKRGVGGYDKVLAAPLTPAVRAEREQLLPDRLKEKIGPYMWQLAKKRAMWLHQVNECFVHNNKTGVEKLGRLLLGQVLEVMGKEKKGDVKNLNWATARDFLGKTSLKIELQ